MQDDQGSNLVRDFLGLDFGLHDGQRISQPVLSICEQNLSLAFLELFVKF